jgi:hypothetical protein
VLVPGPPIKLAPPVPRMSIVIGNVLRLAFTADHAKPAPVNGAEVRSRACVACATSARLAKKVIASSVRRAVVRVGFMSVSFLDVN